jgi:hypothetical protein
MIKKTLPIILAAVLLAGAVSFYGGIKYGQSKSLETLSEAGNFSAGRQGGQQRFASSTAPSGRNMGGSINSGEITEKDDASITIKTQDGSTKIIFYSGSTEILKSATGTASDLEIGKNAIISGTTNQDGSITAKSIQIKTNDILGAPPM